MRKQFNTNIQPKISNKPNHLFYNKPNAYLNNLSTQEQRKNPKCQKIPTNNQKKSHNRPNKITRPRNADDHETLPPPKILFSSYLPPLLTISLMNHNEFFSFIYFSLYFSSYTFLTNSLFQSSITNRFISRLFKNLKNF